MLKEKVTKLTKIKKGVKHLNAKRRVTQQIESRPGDSLSDFENDFHNSLEMLKDLNKQSKLFIKNASNASLNFKKNLEDSLTSNSEGVNNNVSLTQSLSKFPVGSEEAKKQPPGVREDEDKIKTPIVLENHSILQNEMGEEQKVENSEKEEKGNEIIFEEASEISQTPKFRGSHLNNIETNETPNIDENILVSNKEEIHQIMDIDASNNQKENENDNSEEIEFESTNLIQEENKEHPQLMHRRSSEIRSEEASLREKLPNLNEITEDIQNNNQAEEQAMNSNSEKNDDSFHQLNDLVIITPEKIIQSYPNNSEFQKKDEMIHGEDLESVRMQLIEANQKIAKLEKDAQLKEWNATIKDEASKQDEMRKLRNQIEKLKKTNTTLVNNFDQQIQEKEDAFRKREEELEKMIENAKTESETKGIKSSGLPDEEIRKQMEQLRKKLQKSVTEKNILKQKNEDLTNELKKEKQDNVVSKAAAEKNLSQKVIDLQNHKRNLNKTIEKLQKEIKGKNKEIEDNRNLVTSFNEEKLIFNKRIQDLEMQIGLNEQEHNERILKLENDKKVKSMIQQHQDQIRDLLKQNSQLKQNILNLEEQLQSKAEEIQNLNNQLNELKIQASPVLQIEKNSKLSQDVQYLQINIKKQQEQISKLTNNNKLLLNELEKKIDRTTFALEASHGKGNESNEDLKFRLHILEEQNKTYEIYKKLNDEDREETKMKIEKMVNERNEEKEKLLRENLEYITSIDDLKKQIHSAEMKIEEMELEKNKMKKNYLERINRLEKDIKITVNEKDSAIVNKENYWLDELKRKIDDNDNLVKKIGELETTIEQEKMINKRENERHALQLNELRREMQKEIDAKKKEIEFMNEEVAKNKKHLEDEKAKNKEDFDEYLRTNRVLKDRLETLIKKKTNYKQRAITSESKLEGKIQEVEKMIENFKKYKDTAQVQLNEKKYKEEQQKKLSMDNRELQQKNENLKNQILKYKETISEKTSEILRLQNELEKEINRQTNEFVESGDRKNEFIKEISNLNKEKQNLISEIHSLKNDLESQKKEDKDKNQLIEINQDQELKILSLQRQLDEANKTLEEHQTSTKDYNFAKNEAVRNWEQEKINLEFKTIHFENELAKKEKKCTSLIKDYEEQLKSFANERTKFNQEMQTQRQRERNYEETIEKLNSELQQLRNIPRSQPVFPLNNIRREEEQKVPEFMPMFRQNIARNSPGLPLLQNLNISEEEEPNPVRRLKPGLPLKSQRSEDLSAKQQPKSKHVTFHPSTFAVDDDTESEITRLSLKNQELESFNQDLKQKWNEQTKEREHQIRDVIVKALFDIHPEDTFELDISNEEEEEEE